MNMLHMNNIVKLICLWIGCCLFLLSCATPISNIQANYKLNDNTGVILLSLTASGVCGFTYFTEIREINSKSTYSIGMQDFGYERDWIKKNNECPSKPDNYFGKLVAVDLPAGTYEIYQLDGMSRYRKVLAKSDISVKFTVKANKINYLGNIHFHVNKKNFIYGTQDLSQRDIPLFQSKYKQFNTQDIIINLLRMKKVKTLTA